MSLSSLQVLADNHQDLLLAEAAAWLHDYRKCSEEHLQTQARNKSPQAQAIPRPTLVQQYPHLKNVSIIFQNITRSLSDLLDDRTWSNDFLGEFLSRCHRTAHFDKQEPDGGSQDYPGTQISSPFGHERDIPSKLTQKLWKLPWGQITPSYSATDRSVILGEISKLFSQTVADTRHPINEVDLWSWGLLVGALYKASLAGALLTGQVPEANDLRWRLLAIRVDGLEFISNAVRIPDLLARRELVTNALDRVRALIEVTYPLGTEIYRDESGSLYIVPDIPILLELTDQHGTTLMELVQDEFSCGTVKKDLNLQIDGEILPQIELERTSWWGQDPNWPQSSNDQLPLVRNMLTQKVIVQPDVGAVNKWWGKARNVGFCPVCRLRLRREGQDACQTCLNRRQPRVQEWLAAPQHTIWIDEVADTNGRLALIVGQFGLDDWLSGDLVQTMLVKAVENNPSACVPKNPSPARLRRIWETTRTFWQEVLPTDEDSDLAQSLVGQVLGPAGPRLEIRGTLQPQRSRDTLGPYHTYELVVKGVRVSLVWDSDNKRFITCDNLDYLAKPDQLGAPLEKLLTPEGTFTLEEPVGYGAKNKVWGNIAIEQVKPLDDNYTPAIPILAESRTFMALVPANCALEVVKAIKKKYEREMGKVRNRLPLTLGVVYFGRRTPLAAALDAGRRMLKRAHNTEWWEVVCNCPRSAEEGLPEHLQTMCKGHFKRRQEIVLEKDRQKIVLHVSTMVGDGDTEDVWYPYWCVQGKPNDRKRWFVGPNKEHWVHVSELRKGDQVYFTPSTFDFEFLDTAGRRFEVTYENGRRRAGEKAQRPYWLEQVDAIEHTWREMSRLSKSQIYQVRDLVEGKRAEWGKPRGAEALALPQDDVFRCFVGDVLRQAGVYSEELERAALSGMLSDTLELYLEIMKENPQII